MGISWMPLAILCLPLCAYLPNDGREPLLPVPSPLPPRNFGKYMYIITPAKLMAPDCNGQYEYVSKGTLGAHVKRIRSDPRLVGHVVQVHLYYVVSMLAPRVLKVPGARPLLQLAGLHLSAGR